MTTLGTAINIGPALEKQLAENKIKTFEQLKQVGSRKAWLAIQSKDPSACLNRLFALEGAIQNTRWHFLPAKDKQELRKFYEAHKWKMK